MPLDGVPHFDMLHPARRLWKNRAGDGYDDAGCRLSTLERTLFDVQRVGDVPGFEIPGASSGSCAAGTRGRSSRCSSTTASTSFRSRR